MVNKKLAEWLDRKKESLRVYWRSLEEWSKIIVNWARDNVIADPILLPDIRNSGEEFANLPENDVKKVFKMIADDAKGDMIEIDKSEFAIKIKM